MTIGLNKMIIVYGKPRGKGRPRFTTRGRYVATYTDKATKEYEQSIVDAFKESDSVKLEGNVIVGMVAYYPIPKGTSKKKAALMLSGYIRPQVKPDVDNVAKIVLDALNGIAYDDDKQVVECWIVKWYGEIPRVEISIEQEK